VKGDAQALAEFEVVRYKAIVKEKFQARIPKNRISTTTRDTSQIFASKRQLHVVQQSEWQRCLIQEINKPVPIDPEISKIESLTDREREVIALIGEGLKNKQVGERLFISETTVTHHLSSVFSKLEVSDRLELIIYAFRHGLAKMPK